VKRVLFNLTKFLIKNLLFKILIITFAWITLSSFEIYGVKLFSSDKKLLNNEQTLTFFKNNFIFIEDKEPKILKFDLDNYKLTIIKKQQIVEERIIKINYFFKSEILSPRVNQYFYAVDNNQSNLILLNDVEQQQIIIPIVKVMTLSDLDKIEENFNIIKKTKLNNFEEKYNKIFIKIKALEKEYFKNFGSNNLELQNSLKKINSTMSEFKNFIVKENFNYMYFFKENLLEFEKSLDSDYSTSINILNEQDLIFNKVNLLNLRYTNNQKIIDDKINELKLFTENNHQLVNRLEEKNILLKKLNKQNINLFIENYFQSIKNISRQIYFEIDIDKIEAIEFNNIKEFIKLKKIDDEYNLSELNKEFKQKQFKDKTFEFFSAEKNPVLFWFIIIFIFIILPIYIWIKIIRTGLKISKKFKYNLVFSFSFLFNSIGSLLLLINIAVIEGLFNFTNLIALILILCAFYINFKKVGKYFISFSIAQLLSLFTIFFVLAGIGNWLKNRK